MNAERVKHESYRGHDIRSSPREFPGHKWKIRLDITFPHGNGRETLEEYLDEERTYSMLSEAHDAGIEYARTIIDERTKKLQKT